MKDNRQHHRFAIELDAEIRTAEKLVMGRTADVSQGGFCLLAGEELRIGAACEVKLALVFSDNEFSEQLALPATVVWCTRVQDAYQIGLKFGGLAPQDAGYLRLFMNFLNRAGDEPDGDAEEP